MSEPTQADVRRMSFEIAAFCHALYPAFRSARLRIVLTDGEVASFPISPNLLIRSGKPTLESPGGAMESNIIEALSEVEPNDRPTGEVLAELAGYPFNGRFREALARLVKGKHIVNHRPGYSLPD